MFSGRFIYILNAYSPGSSVRFFAADCYNVSAEGKNGVLYAPFLQVCLYLIGNITFCYTAQVISGFANPDAVLTGPETRSSSPVRISRNPLGEAEDLRGLYPVPS